MACQWPTYGRACIATVPHARKLRAHPNSYFCMPAVRASQQMLMYACCSHIATAISACLLRAHRNRYACMPVA
eukprot:9339126-Pyramimonas_sp.AAC.1